MRILIKVTLKKWSPHKKVQIRKGNYVNVHIRFGSILVEIARES